MTDHSEKASQWIEKDSPEYFEFMSQLEQNHSRPFGPSKVMA